MESRSVLIISCLFAGAMHIDTADAGVFIDQDDASRAAYDDGWQNFDDGSTEPSGLGGWVFGGNVMADDATITSSTGNGGGSDIDTGGKSFRLADSDGGGEYIDVFRFIDDGDLAVGRSLSFDLDVNFRSGFKGVRVRGSDDTSPIFRFEVGNPGSGDDYIVYDAESGNGSVGNAYSSDTQFRLELAQDTAAGGSWTITRSGELTDFDSGTYSGVVSSFQLYTTGAGNDAAQAIFYNNFAITAVPEPGSLALGGLGAVLLFSRRKRA